VLAAKPRRVRRIALSTSLGVLGAGVGLVAVLFAVFIVVRGGSTVSQSVEVDAAAESKPEAGAPQSIVSASVDLNVVMEVSGQLLPADMSPGPDVPMGTPMTWRYTVTNTGDTDVGDIVVIDPLLMGRVNGSICSVVPETVTLRPGQTLECELTLPAIAGGYESRAQVNAIPRIGGIKYPKVEGSSTLRYFGVPPQRERLLETEFQFVLEEDPPQAPAEWPDITMHFSGQSRDFSIAPDPLVSHVVTLPVEASTVRMEIDSPEGYVVRELLCSRPVDAFPDGDTYWIEVDVVTYDLACSVLLVSSAEGVLSGS